MGSGSSTGTGTSSTAVEALQHVERLGRYRILARLGQGGMGTIHLAVAFGLADFRKLLVLKELRSELTNNERFVEMFLAEAKLAARLDHPNIVQTLEAGQDGERYFLAMEFLDGQPLVEILKRVDTTQAIPISILIQILCEVLAGLHYAHELCDYDETPLHIVHRDVNPQNVFVTYHGHVKLVDFGIAKVVDSEMCTTAGVFKGKFPYAAPEQVSCTGVDRRADIFAVGVMLWEILAQRRFSPGQPTTAAIDARLAGAEPRILTVRPDLDPELAAICDHAMEVDPAHRYRTAAEFRTDLLDFLASRTEMNSSLTLADLMRREFAPERAAAHRVISTQVRKLLPDEDLPDSLVRVLTRGVTAPGVGSVSAAGSGNGVVTTPSGGQRRPDASKLDTSRARPAGARRSDAPPPSNGELQTVAAYRGRQRMRNLKLSAIAAVAFVGAYFLVRARIDEQMHVPAPEVTSVPAAAPPSAATASAPTPSTAPAAHSGTPADALPVVPSEAEAERAPSRPTALLASGARGGRTRGAREPATADDTAALREQVAPVQSSDLSAHAAQLRAADSEPHGGALRADAEARRQRREASDSEPQARQLRAADAEPARTRRGASQPTADARERSAAAGSQSQATSVSTRPLEVGDDLRSLRNNRKPRPLSLEDPFR